FSIHRWFPCSKLRAAQSLGSIAGVISNQCGSNQTTEVPLITDTLITDYYRIVPLVANVLQYRARHRSRLHSPEG
ncbi:MAG: hypothetical protein WAM44_06970, partial [Chthoniobacterales bacterium]